jgi:hypothetical protein
VRFWGFVFAFLCVVLFSSCEEETKETQTVGDIIKSIEAGDFRGIEIGDDIKKVMAREEKNIVYTMPDELTCRIPLDLKDSTFYEISYNFNDAGLYIIDLIILPNDTFATKTLFKEFKEYYDVRFDKSDAKNGFASWFTSSTRGTDVEISMIDESLERGTPYLSISFYEEEGIAP